MNNSKRNRRTIAFLCAVALTGISAFALGYFLFQGAGYNVWIPAGAAAGLFVGVYLLWSGFGADHRS